MLPRARQAQGEDGFILIEVLVSAVILALVAGAVLTLITATTRSAASARNHSVAYGLAQEDQARMRTLRLSTLKRYENEQTPTIGGTKFKVTSKAFFVNSKSATASCTEQNASTDYVQITSTVSSAAMPNPVSLQSIVSPSSGSLDSTHGSLVFQINNALGGGVSGVTITGSGPSAFTGSSESTGCATFADIPSGNYKVTASAPGLISPEGSSTYVKEQVGAPAGGTQQVLINFDKPGTIVANFVYNEPSKGKLEPAPVDSMEMIESENGGKTVLYGTPSLTNRSATLENKLAYPFKTAYGIYAGACPSSNPDPKSEKINTAALVSVPVTAGNISSATIQVPALNLTVTNSSGKAVRGAKVFLTDTSCKYNGTNVEREYTTNEIGHIASSSTDPTQAKTEAVGLPFGTYNICVQATVSGSTRHQERAGVTVSDLTTAKAAAVSLTSTGGC
jgi:type II secretory pathway pseudopilin PulG